MIFLRYLYLFSLFLRYSCSSQGVRQTLPSTSHFIGIPQEDDLAGAYTARDYTEVCAAAL